jgi:predicted Zn-dependent peptidase
MAPEKFFKSQLSNGIRVVSERINSVHSVALGFWLLAGSKDESEENNGIAHLLEHMAFKGSKNRDAYQIALAIESLGGIINAFTSKNLTCYYVRLMSEHLQTGIDVLSDLILNPLFALKEVEREKGVIIEEIREIEDSPSEIIHDYFAQQLYPNHPLGRPVQGTIETVGSITANQLRYFVNDNYKANRLVIAASGRVSHAELVNYIEKYLEKLPSGNENDLVTDLFPIEQYKKVYHKPTSQSHIIIGRRIFPQADPRRYQLGLFNIILSGGMTSRLFSNIREKYGFVYSIYSFTEFYINTGMFGIYAGVEAERLEKVKSLIYDELRKLSTELIAEEELRKAKQQFEGSLVLSLENMQSRMNRLANMEIFEKKILSIDEILQIIENISSSDLQDIANYIYDESAFIETAIKPKD